MGRLLYMLNVSLDGYIESPEGSLDWATIDDEIHGWFNRRTEELDASIYGRRMWDTMVYWQTADELPDQNPVELEFARIWQAMPKIVFSHSLESVVGNARIVSGDVADELASLRESFPGYIDVSGANLAGQFIERGLVDEFTLVVHPIALGGGKRFWPESMDRTALRLADTTRFTSGVVALHYVVDRG
jgi:dihydrofolate reductase